jgi:hypothetical protein
MNIPRGGAHGCAVSEFLGHVRRIPLPVPGHALSIEQLRRRALTPVGFGPTSPVMAAPVGYALQAGTRKPYSPRKHTEIHGM